AVSPCKRNNPAPPFSSASFLNPTIVADPPPAPGLTNGSQSNRPFKRLLNSPASSLHSASFPDTNSFPSHADPSPFVTNSAVDEFSFVFESTLAAVGSPPSHHANSASAPFKSTIAYFPFDLGHSAFRARKPGVKIGLRPHS